jgi:hypothetical protein
MLKNQTQIIDIETRGEWRVDARTKGPEVVKDGKPVSTWVIVLSNRKGERRFVAEHRVWEFFQLPDAAN